MKKIALVMMVVFLVFSELNVYIAKSSFVGSDNPTTECEEQPESDSKEQPASDSEEESTAGCEEQSESESREEPVTDGEEQTEPDSKEEPTVEGEEQPETENKEEPTTGGEEQPGSNGEEEPTTEGEEPSEPDKENPIAGCEQPVKSDSEEKLATEGEEQLESNSEEDPVIECEEEEPESKENLEMACAEEYYMEEELAMEDEEQLESNSEKEPTIEDEEQLESNGEEEPTIEGEEQLESDSEEELAVKDEEQLALKCKRAITMAPEGMLIDDVGKISDIDFSKLDDSENELEGFTQLKTNEGLKLPIKENGREFYMYFGDIANNRTLKSLKDPNSYKDIYGPNGIINRNNYQDDWLRPLPDTNGDTTLRDVVSRVDGNRYVRAENYVMMTTLNVSDTSSNAVVTYYHSGGHASYSNNPGNGLVITHGNSPGDKSRWQSTRMPLLKLYKNEATHTLIGYAAVIRGSHVDGYVRIKMRSVGKGRVNVSMKYLQFSSGDNNAVTNFAYSVHMDIAGRHDISELPKSKLYSLGDNKGIYFGEEKGDNYKYRYTITDDAYYLFFLRDGYENHPAALKTSNDPLKYPFSGRAPGTIEYTSLFYSTLNSEGTQDPGKGKEYPDIKDHPGWAMRWEPKEQKDKDDHGVLEANLEMAISSTPGLSPEIQLDNDGEYTDKGYRITGTWSAPDSNETKLHYTIDTLNGSEQKVEGYGKLGSGTWEITIPSDKVKGLDRFITVYMEDDYGQKSNTETIKISPTLSITEQVFDKDGNEPKEVAPGETLNYQILVDSGYISGDKGTYGGVTITQTYDTNLEPPTDLKVADEKSGNEIKGATATYNASTNVIEVKPNTTPRSTKVKITFKAKVKDDAPEGESVVGQATASGKYSTGDEVNQTSNEVKVTIADGVLKFVSAPQEIDFGGNLTISSKNKTYYPIGIDRSLAVKDGRSPSKKPSWTMTAKLAKPLTKVGDEEYKLKNIFFRYRYGNNDLTLAENASVEIYAKKTTNREEIDISDTWSTDGEGLYLEVRAGTARVGAYEGVIQWELRDVPLNID
ncbi:hypothetical protein [Lysinibacillus sp. NPDC093688]|uniref:isopeptide-forming domain-containing fimbrial protein n=1 Tax=Lysinibacillus sp. NPDC093688 TaxID=3390577 RepID=UPI003CFE27B6